MWIGGVNLIAGSVLGGMNVEFGEGEWLGLCCPVLDILGLGGMNVRFVQGLGAGSVCCLCWLRREGERMSTLGCCAMLPTLNGTRLTFE